MRVKRAAAVEAPPSVVWEVIADPRRLTRWWPDVQRVEEATAEAWTTVQVTGRGKVIRADFTRADVVAPTVLAWRQEVEESPFERFLSAAETRIVLSPLDAGTRVEIRSATRLRGVARLGAPMVRRATRRRLDRALAGLREAVVRP